MSSLDSLLQSAIASHQAGEFSTAAAGYARILSADPKNADAWHLAGLLAHQNGRSAEGLQQVQLAIGLNPSNAEYYSNLASILNTLERYADALTAAEHSVAINDSFAPAYYQRGHALLNLDRLQDALINFQSAMHLGFAQEVARRDMGLVKQYMGDIPGAISEIERAMELNPRNPQAFFQLSKLVSTGDYCFTDAQVEMIRHLIQRSQRNALIQNRLHVAIATHYEANREFDRAYDHFQIAGEMMCRALKEKGVTYQEEQRTQIIDDLVNFFTPDLFKRFSAAGNPSKRPVFIVGMPRSGTTLLQQIIAQHPSVSSAGELTDLGRLINKQFGDACTIRLRDTLPSINNRWIQSAAGEYLDILEARAAFCKSSKTGPASNSVRYIIDKMPDNYLNVGFIHLLFPNAVIISCLRDPRDVCLSCFCQAFSSDRLQLVTSNWTYLASVYRQYSRLMNHWMTVLPNHVYPVVYENLLDNPQHQIQQLLDFLNLEWDDNCLNFHRGSSQAKTASAAQVRKPLYQSSRNKWQHYEKQMADFNCLIAPEIKSFLSFRQDLASTVE
jgi:Flp pilus assembly protein TadD